MTFDSTNRSSFTVESKQQLSFVTGCVVPDVGSDRATWIFYVRLCSKKEMAPVLHWSDRILTVFY